jgi:hypothetical protein
MASKNPKTPIRARATKSTARPAAPRRRATPKTAVPAEVVTDEPAAALPIDAAHEASNEASNGAAPETSIDYAEQVRIRAYFLSLARQGRPGNPVEDWLAAERELGSSAGR